MCIFIIASTQRTTLTSGTRQTKGRKVASENAEFRLQEPNRQPLLPLLRSLPLSKLVKRDPKLLSLLLFLEAVGINGTNDARRRYFRPATQLILFWYYRSHCDTTKIKGLDEHSTLSLSICDVECITKRLLVLRSFSTDSLRSVVGGSVSAT